MEGKKINKKKEHPKIKIPTRLLFLQKLNSSNSQKHLINTKISDFFNLPEKYFDSKSRILINKKINIKNIESLGQRMKKNISKSIEHRERITNFNRNTTKEEPILKNIETINNEQLKDIFNSYKIKKKLMPKQNLLNHNLSENGIPKQLSIDLDNQSRKLIQNDSAEKKSRQMSKYLSRKINNKEKYLLFNSIQAYSNKKRVLESENSKNSNYQSYIFKWISSLRKPKNFIGKKASYINIGYNNNPLWSTSIERSPDKKEIQVKSSFNFEETNNKELITTDKLNMIENDRIKDLEQINVKGEKLYDFEYNREMSNNNKKIWHKSFIDNGKVIMYKDVNDIFGYETIFKNYNGRNKKNQNNIFLPKYNSVKDIKTDNINLLY